MKRFITLLILILAIMPNCSKTMQKSADTYYAVLGGEPNYLNYVPASTVYESRVNGLIYRSMMNIDYNDNNKLIPSLASKIDISADKKTYTIYMKKGQKWQDGKPVTAHDVYFTYKKILDPKSGAQNKFSSYKDVKSFKVINDYKLIVSFKKRDITSKLTIAGITPIPKHIWQGKSMKDSYLNRHPIGNGEFKVLSWKTGNRITLVRNKLYTGLPKPYFKKVIFKIIPESAAQIAALRKGSIDFIDSVKARTWLDLTRRKDFNKKFKSLRYISTGYSHIAWQGSKKHPYFQDWRVRRAMTMCLDRKKILEKIKFGIGEIHTGPFYRSSDAYDKSIKPVPFNPQKAAKLLDKAGWRIPTGGKIREKNGVKFSFEFSVPQGSSIGKEMAIILKSELTAIGVDMQIRIVEWSIFDKKLSTRDFAACTFAWDNTVDSDIYDLWHSSMAKNGLNFINYKNKEVDKLLELSRITFNKAKRRAINRRLHRIINKEQPYTFLFSRVGLALYDKRLKGVKTSIRGCYSAYPGIAGWSVDKKIKLTK